MVGNEMSPDRAPPWSGTHIPQPAPLASITCLTTRSERSAGKNKNL